MVFINTHKGIIIASTLFLLIGMATGFFIKNIPVIEFEKKVGIMDVFSLLSTLTIAAAAPFLIKKWIDDNQTIKIYLVEEVRVLIQHINECKIIIDEAKKNGKFEQSDRDNVNYAFHTSETQIESIERQLNVSFPKTSQHIIDEIKSAHRAYKDFLTGGELMISTFTTITPAFDKNHLGKYNKLDSQLKEIIHKIHRL